MDLFRKDVYKGLESQPKTLPSKYFYDAVGDQLFRQIMRMPEYYLPAAELEILKTYSGEIADYLLTDKESFEILELGAGDGTKTLVFLQQLNDKGLDFFYRPLDISGHILEKNQQFISASLSGISMQAIEGDFFNTLDSLDRLKESRLTMFMGSNIGNFKPKEAVKFLRFISEHSKSGDLFLIAFDLKKDPEIIINAYHDSQGITAKFNLNLLQRINNELGGDFDIASFKHYASYNPITGLTKSFLISKKAQTVHFSDGESFNFKAYEAIHTEVSCKFDEEKIEYMAGAAGLTKLDWWKDSKGYYSLVLLKKE